MGVSPNLPTFFFLFSSVFFCISQAAIIEFTNQCSYTVWAAAVPGGGRQLKPDETWLMSTNETYSGHLWGRTNCTFNASGNGSCETGDCSNKLDCEELPDSPFTLAEFEVGGPNNLDFYDISLIEGFNIPLEISPDNRNCRKINCSADIKDECPMELRAPGGCKHPCTVFKTDLYCCTKGNNCTATYLTDFFRTKCPDAYSFFYEEATTTFTCPTGSNYRVLFCPLVSSPSPFSPPYDSSLAHMCVGINLRY